MNADDVRQAIEAGLRDSEEGRVVEVDEVRARFGLPKIKMTDDFDESLEDFREHM